MGGFLHPCECVLKLSNLEHGIFSPLLEKGLPENCYRLDVCEGLLVDADDLFQVESYRTAAEIKEKIIQFSRFAQIMGGERRIEQYKES